MRQKNCRCLLWKIITSKNYFPCLLLARGTILRPFHIAMKRQHFEDFEKNAISNFEEIEKNRIKDFEETGICAIFAMLE